jgi:hypothetical protein
MSVSNSGSLRCTVCWKKLVQVELESKQQARIIPYGEKICVDQDGVRRHKSSVVLKEQSRGDLWPITPSAPGIIRRGPSGIRFFHQGGESIHFSHNLAPLICLLCTLFPFLLVFLEPRIILRNDSFDLAMLECGVALTWGKLEHTAPNLRTFFAVPIVHCFCRYSPSSEIASRRKMIVERWQLVSRNGIDVPKNLQFSSRPLGRTYCRSLSVSIAGTTINRPALRSKPIQV